MRAPSSRPANAPRKNSAWCTGVVISPRSRSVCHRPCCQSQRSPVRGSTAHRDGASLRASGALSASGSSTDIIHHSMGDTVSRLPEGKDPALRVMPMPADANQNGDIFGGWIMSQVDIAGGTVAGRVAKGRVATVAVNSFVFKQPVQIGDLLSFYVDLVKIGNTSITVNVEVYAERRPSDPTVVRVTEATLTYVAIDRDGRPRPVPRA